MSHNTSFNITRTLQVLAIGLLLSCVSFAQNTTKTYKRFKIVEDTLPQKHWFIGGGVNQMINLNNRTLFSSLKLKMDQNQFAVNIGYTNGVLVRLNSYGYDGSPYIKDNLGFSKPHFGLQGFTLGIAYSYIDRPDKKNSWYTKVQFSRRHLFNGKDKYSVNNSGTTYIYEVVQAKEFGISATRGYKITLPKSFHLNLDTGVEFRHGTALTNTYTLINSAGTSTETFDYSTDKLYSHISFTFNAILYFQLGTKKDTAKEKEENNPPNPETEKDQKSTN